MENHPIPQDVTGFKFKLIGSVTIKQFLYLLGFGILTTVAFVLNVNIFIKIPLMLMFALAGVALAFVPLEGRPMDIMLVNFAKTIPFENRYIFRKRGANLANFEVFKRTVKQSTPIGPQKAEADYSGKNKKRAILLNRLRNSSFRPDESDLRLLDRIKSFFESEEKQTQTLPSTKKVIPHLIEQQIEKPITPKRPIINADEQTIVYSKPGQLTSSKRIEEIQKQLDQARKMQEESMGEQDLTAKVKELEEELQKALQDKDALSKKIVEFELDKTKREETVFKPSEQEEEKQQTQNVRFVAASSQLKAGFPSLPDIPNIVLGIVKDSRGKTLPNILVEVVDQNNTPVRAFKTNALGQFASVTALPDGIYKIYFDDPQKQHKFEIIQIELTGEIFNPLEVISVDAREKLRRELFGSVANAT